VESTDKPAILFLIDLLDLKTADEVSAIPAPAPTDQTRYAFFLWKSCSTKPINRNEELWRHSSKSKRRSNALLNPMTYCALLRIVCLGTVLALLL
jgi:hypothetical protein